MWVVLFCRHTEQVVSASQFELARQHEMARFEKLHRFQKVGFFLLYRMPKYNVEHAVSFLMLCVVL